MPTTKRKPRQPEPIGHITFESCNDRASWTNEEHVAQLLKELPFQQAGVVILNMDDRQLEAMIRSNGPEGMEIALSLAEALHPIAVRQQAGVDICRKAAARLLVVLDRINGGAP